MAIIVNNLSVSKIETDEELYSIWPTIRKGIKRLEDKCSGIFYMPEDYYFETKLKRMQLLVGHKVDTGEYCGFAFIQETQYPDGKGLHIFAMHHDGIEAGFIDNCFAVIEIIANLCKVKRISFSSSRKGWSRSKEAEYKEVSQLNYYERAL